MNTNTIVFFALSSACSLLIGCALDNQSVQYPRYHPRYVSVIDKLAAQRDIDGLIKRMENAESHDRRRSAYLLGEFGAGAKNAVSGLAQWLKYDTDRVVRENAAEALGKIGVHTMEVLLALGEGLSDDWRVRESAHKALQALRVGIVEHVSDLTGIFHNSSDHGMRAVALKLLAYAGSPGVSVVKGALRDSEKKVKILATELLTGALAKEAIPELIESLNDSDLIFAIPLIGPFQENFHRAVESLESIGPEIIPQLIHLLQHPSEDVRGYILISLAHFGPEARTAVPAILTLLKGGTYWDRRYASSALREMGYASIPRLLLVLQEKDRVRGGWLLHDDVISILTYLNQQVRYQLPILQRAPKRNLFPFAFIDMEAHKGNMKVDYKLYVMRWGTDVDMDDAAIALREALTDKRPAVQEAVKGLLTFIDLLKAFRVECEHLGIKIR